MKKSFAKSAVVLLVLAALAAVVVLTSGFAVGLIAMAEAEGVSRPAAPASRVAAPAWQQQLPEVKAGSVELGLLGGYALAEDQREVKPEKFEDFEDFAYGGYANFMWKFKDAAAAAGVEVDAMRFSSENDLANWLMSVRGRGGFYVAANTMVFGTAGWAWETDSGLDGSVVGGGIETSFGSLNTRLEYLHYEVGDAPLDVMRAGIGVKF